MFTGHERVFTPATIRIGTELRWHNFDADCSWLAVPRLPLEDVRSALVVRHPLDVVASMAHIRFGSSGYNNAYAQVAENAGMTPDPDGWLRFWLNWNRKALDHVGVWFRFEQLLADPGLLTRWADAPHEPRPLGVVNDRPEWKKDERPIIGWDHIQDDKLRREAQELWERL